MKLLIIGGVAGGASAAARARRLSEGAHIILFERGPDVSFANCGLPYFIGGEIAEREKLIVTTLDRVTQDLLDELHHIRLYTPEHLPRKIELIEAFARRHPKLSQVACFDTAFHRTMPRVARLLPIPRRCTTSVDVTKLCIDKAYGIEKLREILGIELEEMLFAGDALFPGGNDYPVKEAGVVSIQVNNAEETKRVIETFLASGAGIESAARREEVAR